MPTPRSPDDLLRLTIGDLVVQLTVLRAENEALKEALAGAPATNGHAATPPPFTRSGGAERP